MEINTDFDMLDIGTEDEAVGRNIRRLLKDGYKLSNLGIGNGGMIMVVVQPGLDIKPSV